jgi:aminoglycoside/choline kinase family phosphotransferase
MELFIILTLLIAVCVVIAKKTYNDDLEIWSIVFSFLFGLYLLMHTLFWSLASYDYNSMVAKRNAFQETLTEARKNGREIELAAISQNISEWNQELASAKYNNTVFLLKDYTDDRIDSLEPIR